MPTGTKSYVFQYRTTDRRDPRRATIGKVGSLTPDQAREIAEEMSRKVKSGGDPLDDKRKAREALTVGQLLDAYLASETFADKADTTRSTDTGRIERHLRPLLGGRHINKLQPEDIRRAFAAIRDGKTAATIKTSRYGLARVIGGEGTARKAVRLLRAIFTWGIKENIAIDRNPADGVSTGSDGERDVVLEQEAQYVRLFEALATMERERRLTSPVADAIRIIAMTGARRGEVTGLRWQHVDLKRGQITLPARGHKTGRKTGKPRIITLPTAAQEIIARQPERGPGDFVFASTKARQAGSAGEAVAPHSRRGRLAAGYRITRAAPFSGDVVSCWRCASSGNHGLRLDIGKCPRRRAISILPTRPAPLWPNAPPPQHWRAWLLPLAHLTPTSSRCTVGKGRKT